MNNYRFYSFTNMYLSSLQKGIQTAHAVSEMSIKEHSQAANKVYNEWATSDKTIIVLNGGSQKSLDDIFKTIYDYVSFYCNFSYPFVNFYEDKDSLNGALTCVGIILPEDEYIKAKNMREGKLTLQTMSALEYDFYSLFANSSLAN